MDSAADAILELEVHLWDVVSGRVVVAAVGVSGRWVGEDGGLHDITDGSRFNHVSDGESLDGLVLRSTS